MADHFPELPADCGGDVEFHELPGPLVGEQDALLGVDRDHALDHATEDSVEHAGGPPPAG